MNKSDLNELRELVEQYELDSGHHVDFCQAEMVKGKYKISFD